MKNFSILNPVLLAGGALVCLLAFAAYSLYTLEKPKGLRISPPDLVVSPEMETTSKSVAASQQSFAGLSPASFSMAFGLDYYRDNILPAVASESVKIMPVEEKKAPETEKPAVKAVDLAAIGYRLKGIVLEKDGNSAAFIYDPEAKKVVIARERASEAVRLVKAFLRSVKLATPHGEGMLELDPVTIAGRRNIGSARSFAAVVTSAAPQNNTNAGTNISQKPAMSASVVASIINSGQFNVSHKRGSYSVEVKNVPDSFAGYDLTKGDQIVGTDGRDFKRSQDIALELGKIKEKPVALKIIRDGKVMHLSPPAPSGTQTKNKQQKP